MKNIGNYIVITLGAFLVALGFNQFLIPHQLLSGGMSGISMLIGYTSGWNIGLLYFILNIPVLIWGFFIIGRRFIFLSVASVVFTTLLLQWLPQHDFSGDPLLAAVFGGAIAGIGIGISFRAGGSTGGFDIIGSIVTRRHDFPLGMLLFALNGIVIVALGYVTDDWSLALYSMLSIFIAGKVIDYIHIGNVKVTLFIVTDKKEKMLQQLLKRPRGVTIIPTYGGFSNTHKDMLMTVTTRYELASLRKMIKDTDERAFVNIVNTVGVIGEFKRY